MEAHFLYEKLYANLVLPPSFCVYWIIRWWDGFDFQLISKLNHSLSIVLCCCSCTTPTIIINSPYESDRKDKVILEIICDIMCDVFKQK
jgi:hypothetical protein